MPVTHDDLVDKVVARLKANAAVAAVVSTSVYTDADLPGSPAVPYIHVTKGTNHGAPVVAGPVMNQADVRVKSFADGEAPLGDLLVKVQASLNGFLDLPVRQSVLIDTGAMTDVAGTWSRQDAFAIFFVP